MPRLPHVRPGQRLGSGDSDSASAWNNLFQQVQRIERAVFGSDLHGFNLPGARIVHRQAADPVVRATERTVCVVQTPVAGDHTLKVRPVRYKDPQPPRPCETAGQTTTCFIEFTGELFDAYPDFGFGVLDYEDFAIAETDVLDDETPYLRARLSENQWIVEPKPVGGGGGGIRPAVVVTANAGASTIRVQPMKRSGSTWVADGPQVDRPLWGGQKADDFITLKATGTDVLLYDYVPLITLADGIEYALQYFWMYAKTPNTSISRGDCGL